MAADEKPTIVFNHFIFYARGMLTLPPAGIPHDPHPGVVEKSIGAKETKELAVMVDTFRPLKLTQTALEIENEGYVMSWAE